MFGSRLRISLVAMVAFLGAGAARAADLAIPPPPPPQPCCNNWYLRSFVGVGMNNDTLEYQPNPANVGNGFTFQSNSIADRPFQGFGVGFIWNNWLRFEAKGEYRSRTRVYAFGKNGASGLDTYEGYLHSAVFLGNAFVDLGTWNCFTPFIGAGVGFAYNMLSDFTDVNPNGGYGFGRNPSEFHLAWALYAGMSYEVTPNFHIDLTYRYLNYGSITDTVDCAGGCNPDSFEFKNLYSNDIMLGMRWTCCDIAPPPRVVYRPPPPPPLESRG